MEPKYDAIILTTAKDFRRLEVNYPHLVANMIPRRVIFIGNSEVGELVQQLNMGDKVGFVNEDDIIPFDHVHQAMMRELEVTELARGVTGWYYQQFLKMQYSAVCPDDYYLVWDGDTVPCQPFKMFREEDGVPYFDLKTEYHEDYFITLAKLFPGMNKTIQKSFISEHMIMNCSIMQKMIADIMKNEELKGSTFYEKIISAVGKDKLRSNSFSEFETYGTYVSLRHTSAYRLRNWKSLRFGGVFFDPHTITDEEYAWLGKDFDAVSFEKGHSVSPEIASFFAKKEYREKLTARQMLEIIQGECEEGYFESWDDYDEPSRTKVDANEYKIYVDLAQQYLVRNVNQAYLCYENAEYLCQDEIVKQEIRAQKEALLAEGNVTVRKASIVIVSYNCQHLMKKCIESIRQTCHPDSYQIVVVDNASTDGIRWWLQQQSDIKLVLSDENLGFPRGCNVGAEYSDKENDIFLLNNDTRMTHNALFWLRMGLYRNEKTGATGCIANYAGNDQKVPVEYALVEQYLQYAVKVNVPNANPYEERNRLCGFAMLVKREAWDKAGGMDEKLSPGYFDDDDLSLAIREHGYELYICHNSFIYHAGSQSFRKREDIDAILSKNFDYLVNKWGYDVPRSSLSNRLAIERLGQDLSARINILEIGAGCGSTLSRIQHIYRNATVYGIEKNSLVVEKAIKSVSVYQGDWETMTMPFPEGYFDYIIYTNRGKQSVNAEALRARMGIYLKQGGVIFV